MGKPKRYGWGDGAGKIHTISRSTHQKHIRAKSRARRDAAANNPGSLTDPLTPRTLDEEMRAALQYEFGPQERELNSQIAEGNQRQTNITGWYKQYLDAVNGAKTASDTNYANAAKETASAPPVLTGDKTTDEAALSRHALDTAWSNMVKTQGLAAGTNYQNQANQAPLLELGSHQQQDRANDKLKTALRGLLSDKGAAAIKYRSDARAGERDWLATSETLRQAGVKIANDAIPTPSEEKTQADLDFFKEHGYYPPTGPPKKTKPGETHYGIDDSAWQDMTPAERKQAKNDWEGDGKNGKKPLTAAERRERNKVSNTVGGRIDRVGALWDQWKGEPVYKNTADQKADRNRQKATPSDLKARLIDSKEKFTPDEIHLALVVRKLKRTGGYMSPADRKLARRLGWKVPNRYRAPKPAKVHPNP